VPEALGVRFVVLVQEPHHTVPVVVDLRLLASGKTLE
jgi:hypothetical protein